MYISVLFCNNSSATQIFHSKSILYCKWQYSLYLWWIAIVSEQKSAKTEMVGDKTPVTGFKNDIVVDVNYSLQIESNHTDSL